MSTKARLQRFSKYVPDHEHLMSRSVTIHNNFLYFKGDTCMVTVENFVQSNADFSIQYRQLLSALSMSGNVSIEQVDAYRIMFTNGKAKMTMAVTQVTEPPIVELPEDSDFEQLSPVFRYSRNLFLLADDALVSACNIDGTECTTLTSKYILAGVPGSIHLEAGLDKLASTLRIAVIDDAMIWCDDRHLAFKSCVDDTVIRMVTTVTKPSVSAKAREMLMYVMNKKYQDLDTMVFTIHAADLDEINGVIQHMNYGRYITYEVTESAVKITAIDEFRTEFTSTIPCTASSKGAFKTLPLDKGITSFLAASREHDNPLELEITVVWNQKHMIIRARDGDVPGEAFILVGFSPAM